MSRRSATVSLLLALAASMPAAAATIQEAPAQPAQAQPAQAAETGVPAVPAVIDHLDTVSPFNLAYVVTEKWEQGDRLQAAFWFYIWQIRTLPWAEIDPEVVAARTTLNEQLGTVINSWIASDPELWKQVTERAIAHEARLPVWSERPEGVAQEFWARQLSESRATYASELHRAFAEMSPDRIRQAREQHGLPVGPLTDTGTPLPDDWR